MSAGHTPGLLTVSKAKHMGGEFVVATLADERGDRALVIHAQIGAPTQADEDENARRLVACWNACDGIDTEFLEQAPKGGDQSVWSRAAIGRLRAQRDKLISAARPLVAMTFSEARSAEDTGRSLMFCRHDALNPCWDGAWSKEHGAGKHWGGGDACPECNLRAAISEVGAA